ncbi:hypothetical protein [Halopiger goleimassiliensis]|nr:hypothetical protein [Halopiger goleimassiliensis]
MGRGETRHDCRDSTGNGLGAGERFDPRSVGPELLDTILESA